MNFKKIIVGVIVILCLVSTVGCKGSKKDVDKSTFKEEKQTQEADMKSIAFITDLGNIDDKSFNQGCWEGILDFCKDKSDYKKQYFRALSDTVESRNTAIEQGIDNGAGIIICAGSFFQKSIYDLQDKYPDRKFLLIDTTPVNENGDEKINENVHCVEFKEEEAGYLAGYSAIKEGYRKLGFLGGIEGVPAIKDFGYGYAQGAEQAAKELKLNNNSIELKFWYAGSFQPSDKITKKMEEWYKDGTQVIFSCGGGILYSVIEATGKDSNRKIIGVDNDQADESEKIIFSSMKGLKSAIVLALKDIDDNKGNWSKDYAGKSSMVGVAEDCVGLSATKNSWRMKNYSIEEYNKLYESIKKKGIKLATDELPELKYVKVDFIKNKSK